MRTPHRLITVFFVVSSVAFSGISGATGSPSEAGGPASLGGARFTPQRLLTALEHRLGTGRSPDASGGIPLSFRSVANEKQSADDDSDHGPFYYLSESYNPGDLDGDGFDDVLLIVIDQDMNLRIFAYRGTDGAQLWTWSRDFSGYSWAYIQWADLTPAAGNELVIHRISYVEHPENMLDPLTYSAAHLLQEIQVLSGSDGSERWRWDQPATFSRYVGLTLLPRAEDVFEIKDLVTSLYPIKEVAGGETLFMAVSSFRESVPLIDVGMGERERLGSVSASFRDGNGSVLASFDRTSSAGMPFGDAVGDLSRDGLADVVSSIPRADGRLGIQAARRDGFTLWEQQVEGEAALFRGFRLTGGEEVDVVARVDFWEEESYEFETRMLAYEGSGGSPLWTMDGEVPLVAIGDADGRPGTELLVHDPGDPYSGAGGSVEVLSGRDLERVWGPLVVTPPVEGKEVSGTCFCEPTDLDGDGVQDVVFSRSMYADGGSDQETVGISGRSGEELWRHGSVWTAARPIRSSIDMNGNGTSDLWAVEWEGDNVFTFYEGSDASVISELRLTGYWNFPFGGNLTAAAQPEIVFHSIQTWDGYRDRSAAYSGQQRLWEISHI